MSIDENCNEQVEDELKEVIEVVVEEVQVEDEVVESEEFEVDVLCVQVKEVQEQMLCFQVEMQNVCWCVEIDVEKVYKFVFEKFVKELLLVVDSLEKVVESIEGNDNVGELVVFICEGVEMILNLFMSSFGKFNVEQLNLVGELFDLQQYEVMFMVLVFDVEFNSVVVVVQKGYLLNGCVVCLVMVMVVKVEDVLKIDEQV